jgi:hypothetical protein
MLGWPRCHSEEEGDALVQDQAAARVMLKAREAPFVSRLEKECVEGRKERKKWPIKN